MTRWPRLSRRRPSTDAEQGLGLLMVLLAAMLIATLGAALPDDASRVLEVGESLPLETTLHNGAPHEIGLPGSIMTLRVGTPVEEVAASQVDLGDDADPSATGPVAAETGGRLVPVSWTSRRTDRSAGWSEDDREPTEITLVADGEKVDLSPGTTTRSSALTETHARVVALDQGVEHADLTVEVTYDGATQVLTPANGDIDRGDAEGIDEPTTSIATGCEDHSDRCRLTAGGAEWRPPSNESTFTADALRISAYDEELGWAGPGRRWASVSIRVHSTLGVENATGEHRDVDRLGRIEASLDGEPAESTSGLGPAEPFDSRQGRAVFVIDADSPPKELVLEQELTLAGDASPRTTTTRKEIHLDADQ